MSNDALVSLLSDYYVPTRERCGLVLRDGRVVELKNSHPNPEINFRMTVEDMEVYADEIVATWHTHTHDSANLSSADWHMFINSPQFVHYIVANGEVCEYYIQNGKVMRRE